MGEPIAWSVGLQWQQESLEQTTDTGVTEVDRDKQTQRVEASLHADWLHQNTELGFSSRAIKDDRFNAVWIQQLQGKQVLVETDDQDWSLRYSIGQGYRAPTLKESYYVFDHRYFGYMMLGNQNLKPETSLMTQLGLMWQYQQVLQWQLNLAYDQIQHLIDMAAAGSENGIALYQYRNINKANLWSVETQVIYSPWSYLEWHLGYTYLDARDQASTPLTHRPRHNARLGMQYQATEQWSWLLNGQIRAHEYYSKNAVGLVEDNDRFLKKTAWLWDLATTYQFRSGVQVNLGVNNITDQYMDEAAQGSFEDARPALGRVYQSSIQYNF
jgi:outer membrane receptor for ferrienterochelin and colicins